jgi:release factor glutamine methyltransferase
LDLNVMMRRESGGERPGAGRVEGRGRHAPGVVDEGDVYEPAEDTLLVLRGLRARPGDRVLEVGTGRGDIAIAAALAGARVFATDVNPAAVAVAAARCQRAGAAVEFAVADLFGPFLGPFDLVVMNPPYLPTDAGDRVEGALNAAFDGGPDGLAVTRRLLAGLPRRLARGGRGLVVVSSLSPWDAFLAAVPRGFRARVTARARFAFEEIRLVEVARAPPSTRRGAARCPRGRRPARSGTPRGRPAAPRARAPPARGGGGARRRGRPRRGRARRATARGGA